jgi:diacylglycerol kinase family enzyme
LYYVSESIPGTDEFIQTHFEEVDIFVAIGGDGTISTVAKNLINTEKVLAIFPAGSGNGFSNETRFSKNLDELLEKIKAKNPERSTRLQ